MKRILTLILALSILIGFGGCSTTTTPQQAVFNSEGTIIATANAAMMAWATWVNGGNATQAQVDQVKGLYDSYYQSQMIAKAAAISAAATPSANNQAVATAAQAQLVKSESSLITLVSSLTTAPKK